MSAGGEDELVPLWKYAFSSAKSPPSQPPSSLTAAPISPAHPSLVPFLPFFHGVSGGAATTRLTVECSGCDELFDVSKASLHNCGNRASLKVGKKSPTTTNEEEEVGESCLHEGVIEETPTQEEPLVLGPEVPLAELLESIPFECEPFPSLNGRYPGEREALVEIRELLGESVFAEACGARDLVKRAVRGHVAKGVEPPHIAQVLQTALQWRAEVGGEALFCREGFEALGPRGARFLGELWPTRLCGPDRFGHPVVVERVREVRPGLIEAEGFTCDEVVVLRAFVMECVALQARWNSKNATFSHASTRTNAGPESSTSGSGSGSSTPNAATGEDGRSLSPASASSSPSSSKDNSSASKGGALPYEVSQAVWVFDMGGLSMAHFSGEFKELVLAAAKVANAVALDTVFRIYIVNAPLLFRVLWALATKLMSPVTIAKVRVLGDSVEAATELDTDIGLATHRRPAWLGGTAGEADLGEGSEGLPTKHRDCESDDSAREEEEKKVQTRRRSQAARPVVGWCRDGEAPLVRDLVMRWPSGRDTLTAAAAATSPRCNDDAGRGGGGGSGGSGERQVGGGGGGVLDSSMREAKRRALAERMKEIDAELPPQETGSSESGREYSGGNGDGDLFALGQKMRTPNRATRTPTRGSLGTVPLSTLIATSVLTLTVIAAVADSWVAPALV